jgi:hypothetical protein
MFRNDKGRGVMFVEPLGGRWYISASRQRARQDWAREVKTIVTEEYPQPEKVVLSIEGGS